MDDNPKSVWDSYDWENAPLIDDDDADWLKTQSWGGLPETGQEFMEYMGWYDLSRAEQREAVEDFMESERAKHMPELVKQFFVDLGLLE